MIDVRQRISDRVNRERLKLELKRSARPLVVVAIGAATGLLFWAYQVWEVAQYAITDSRELRFAVDDATAVVPERQEVRFKGIPAGTITEVKFEGPQPVLTVKLYKEFGPVYRDARARLRPNTALEDMYLDIVHRGTRRAGEATAARPLPPRQTDTSVQIEEVLQVFNPEVRTRLGVVMRDLGGGLGDRGDELREAFVRVVPFLRTAARMTDQLAERSRQTRRLVHNFSVLTAELAQRDEELRTLTSDGSKTLRTLATSSDDLEATIRELPGTLAELDASSTAVLRVLPHLDTALVRMRPVADRLPEGLSALRALSDTAAPAVRELRQPVRDLVPLAEAAPPFAASLEDALEAMRPQTDAISHITKSTAGCTRELLYFFLWIASYTKFEDARGGFPRGHVAIGFGGNSALPAPLGPVAGCAPGMPKADEP